MRSIRIPLVGSLTNRKAGATTVDTTDQQFTNCFPEVTKNSITGKTGIVLNKRPGSQVDSTVSTFAGSFGAVTWTTNSGSTPPPVLSFVKSSTTTTRFYKAGGTQVGGDVGTTSNCSFMSETKISGTGNLTAVLTDSGTGASEFWFFPEGGAWTQITDVDFPSNPAISHGHMDGYMFVMTTDGKIYNSDLDSLASWTAGNYISVSGGGNGVGLVKYRNFIVGFTDYSTEFFYNAGNASGSILKRVNDGVIKVGAQRDPTSGPPSIRVMGDSIYFVGKNSDSGDKGVYRLTGMKLDKISNTAVDRLVSNGGLTYIVGSFSMLGMTHLMFGLTGSICYCVEMNFWWYFGLGGGIGVSAIVGASDNNGKTATYFCSASNGNLYISSPNSDLWQDNSLAYTMTVQTESLDLGTRNKKYWIGASLVGDSQSSTSNVSISYSDDDYGSFSTARTIDMNVVPPPRLTRLGASRRRAWKLTNSASTQCRLSAMDLEYEIGPT